MIYLRKLGQGETTLIMKGKAFYFDMLNEFKREVPVKFINLEQVQIISFITQGNQVEVAYTDKEGNVTKRLIINMSELLPTIDRLKKEPRYIVTLTKTVRIGEVVSKQYIVVYKTSSKQ
ncbi:hypothetical protein [Bacillus toyonensis]|uniref:hypothetical protein n=1 Tax=Bacillus toyonensis TaxID=155322 RepID=UPI000BF603C3|nr:hypothetical protein [Bacillus toyonensis]PGF05072.1 hypothetical protein COM61_01165 [Bacillus toyonensis]